MKFCINCNIEKELSDFDKRKNGYRNQCRVCLHIKRKERYERLPEEEKEKIRINRNERNRNYRMNISKETLIYRRIRKRENHVNRLENDPLYKLRISYTRRLNKYIKKFSTKNVNFLDNLGCSLDEFKSHLESKFETWMNWDNYGKYNGEFNYGWDIDHIIPISSAKTESEFNILCNYTNLQPLCSKINRDIKKNKIKNPQ